MKRVDRSFARMIAYKRLFTGTLGLTGGVVMLVIAASRGGIPTPLAALSSAIFFGGGAWSLRDGVRLLRELSRTAPAGSTRSSSKLRS